MKTLLNFISKNFLLYLLFVFVVARAVTFYAISEYQNDMAFQYTKDYIVSTHQPISEQSLTSNLSFAIVALEK